MSTPRIERETVITWNEEEPEAMVWSASPVFQRRMERLGIGPYKTSAREGTEESRYYKVDKKRVGVKAMNRGPGLSEEQREARAERMRQMRKKQMEQRNE